MKTWLERDAGAKFDLSLPFVGAVTATCAQPCPCGSSSVVGDGIERVPTERDEYVARAFCAACKARRGVIHASVETLFGTEEDEAVLHGRWRVY
jgi:hypothetical protein